MPLALVLGGLNPAPPPSAAAAPDVPQPLKVVLLGDSYSAGNGARTSSDDRDYYGPKGCYRSHSNWAEQYVDSLQAAGYEVTFLNRACSGAVTADVLSDRDMDTQNRYYSPQPGYGWPSSADEALAQIIAADPCNTNAYPDEEYWTHEVMRFDGPGLPTFYSCLRHLTAQVDAIGPDTDLVLFTIGGNDMVASRLPVLGRWRHTAVLDHPRGNLRS